MTGATEWTVPYWHVNMPPDQCTTECPEYLQGLSEKDLGIISARDEDYQIRTWTEGWSTDTPSLVQDICRRNRLDLFHRAPLSLRKYLQYMWGLKKQYGSVMAFVLSERLKWSEPVKAAAAPFQDPSDFKVLWNDWPYNMDPKIVHLVVWTKFDLEEDLETGDLTPKARQEIEDYVNVTFYTKVPKENVVWFKNWKSLKSIHAVEHFHVMLYDPDPKFIDEITGGDIPLSKKVAAAEKTA